MVNLYRFRPGGPTDRATLFTPQGRKIMANGSSATAEEIGRTYGTDYGVLAALMAIHMPGPEEIAAVNLELS